MTYKPTIEIDPDTVRVSDPIGLFLHGFNNERLLQWKERKAVDEMEFGTVGRFIAEQRLDVYAVARGLRDAGLLPGVFPLPNEDDPPCPVCGGTDTYTADAACTHCHGTGNPSP